MKEIDYRIKCGHAGPGTKKVGRGRWAEITKVSRGNWAEITVAFKIMSRPKHILHAFYSKHVALQCSLSNHPADHDYCHF